MEDLPESSITSKGVGVDAEEERVDSFFRKSILGAKRLEMGHPTKLNSLRVGNLPSTRQEGIKTGSKISKSKREGREERDGQA